MADDRALQDSGPNGLLQRRFNTAAAPSTAFAPEVFPTVPVSDYPAAEQYLSGWRLASCYAQVGALAGTPSQLFLTNPAGSGIIAEIQLVEAAVGAGGVLIGRYTGALTGSLGAVNTVPVDTRWPINAVTRLTGLSGSIENAAALAAAARMFRYFYTAALMRQTPFTAVITPGHTLIVATENNNTFLYTSVVWRERRAQPAEL